VGRRRMAWRAFRGAPLTSAEEMAISLLDRRLRVVPAASLAAVALVVALVGVFALLGRVAAEGRREFAIRLALGASRGRVVSMMLRRAASMTGLGIAMGLAGTTLVAGGLRGLLYGVGPQDPLTLAAVVSFVCVVAVGAAILPARQASRAHPQELLWSE
jgi:putative ABC transport system permease protein